MRRLVSIPAVLSLAVLAALAAPLWLALLALTDLARRRRLASLRLGLFVAWFLACEAIGILAAGAVWLQRALLREDEATWRTRNFRLQRWWASMLFRGSRRIYGFRLEVEWRGEPGPAPVLVFLRHVSIADTLLGAALFTIPQGLRLRYVLKRELLWDPCLDIVGHRLPNVFVRRDGADSASEIRAVAALARDLGTGEGVLIYPEGTRFTPAKRRRVLARLRERGPADLLERAERMHHVLPPRPGGPLALLREAASADVVLCMHTGFERTGTLGDLWSGHLIDRTVWVRCVTFPRRDLPSDLQTWLLDRWEEVDAFVASHREAV